MKALGANAGGDPPLPRRPDLSHLDDLDQRAGNDQLKAILERKEQLLQELKDWQARATAIAQRLPRWHALQALLQHATTLPEAEPIQSEARALEEQRGLLNDPDPAPGLVDQLTQALRSALNAAHERCEAEGMANLAASETWNRLTPEDRDELSRHYHLDHLPEIQVGSTDEVLNSLKGTKLEEWTTLCDALPTRFSQALAAAARRLEPQAQPVKLAGGTIKDEADLKAWLKNAESQIRAKLKDGPVIL